MLLVQILCRLKVLKGTRLTSGSHAVLPLATNSVFGPILFHLRDVQICHSA